VKFTGIFGKDVFIAYSLLEMEINHIEEILNEEEDFLDFDDLQTPADEEQQPMPESDQTTVDSEKTDTVALKVAQDCLIYSNFRFFRSDSTFTVDGKAVHMKVELLSAMSPLKFNGGTIARPPQTVLRSGDEVFICSPTRAAAAGKSFIMFGIFQLDNKNPAGASVLLVDEHVHPRDASNLTNIFKAAPLKFVGLVPQGKCVDETKHLLGELEPLCRQLFETFAASNLIKPLATLDFYQIARPKRNEQRTLKKSPPSVMPKQQLKFENAATSEHVRSPVKHSNKAKQKRETIETPPNVVMKRIEHKLDSLQDLYRVGTKKDGVLVKRLQTQISKLTDQNKELREANESLSKQLVNAACLEADNNLLRTTNIAKQEKIEELIALNSAQLSQIDDLSRELKVYKESIGTLLEPKRSSKKYKNKSNKKMKRSHKKKNVCQL
jgi:hypothetical protein